MNAMNFDYTGAVQEVTLNPGKYILECWGAQGGYRTDSSKGGKGGYSVGTIDLQASTKLFVYVGGQATTTSGGFNGGGSRSSYNGGGGGSDIRIGQDSLYARVIVAGGGGSDGSTSNAGAAGGGGWYGGGGVYPDSSGDDDKGGGGGSGFVWQGSNAPSGYLLGSEYYLTDAQTIAGSSSFTSPTGTSETGHAGNGYVRITQLKPNPPTNLTETHDYFGASLSWTGVSGVSGYKVYLNGTLKATTTATSYQLLGLNASTDYTVKVIAYDATGESDPVWVTFTTPSANFRQTERGYQTISLAWNSSAKATGYKLYRNGTLIATLTGTNYTDSGLLPSNEYNYSLRAYSGSSEGISGTLTGKTEEAGWEQKVVFKTIKIVPNPTTINTKVTLTVTAEDKLVIYEPEKFYSGEIYSGEL